MFLLFPSFPSSVFEITSVRFFNKTVNTYQSTHLVLTTKMYLPGTILDFTDRTSQKLALQNHRQEMHRLSPYSGSISDSGSENAAWWSDTTLADEESYSFPDLFSW